MCITHDEKLAITRVSSFVQWECPWLAAAYSEALARQKYPSFCAPFALHLCAYECFPYPYMSSADLHVIELTFKRGFDSFRAHHVFNRLPNLKSLRNHV